MVHHGIWRPPRVEKFRVRGFTRERFPKPRVLNSARNCNGCGEQTGLEWLRLGEIKHEHRTFLPIPDRASRHQ